VALVAKIVGRLGRTPSSSNGCFLRPKPSRCRQGTTPRAKRPDKWQQGRRLGPNAQPMPAQRDASDQRPGQRQPRATPRAKRPDKCQQGRRLGPNAQPMPAHCEASDPKPGQRQPRATPRTKGPDNASPGQRPGKRWNFRP
jgi:hypothetical protein